VDGASSAPISRASSSGDCRRDREPSANHSSKDQKNDVVAQSQQEGVGLFHVIQQLAAAENALWNILDGLKSNTTHASFFCREYWGSSGSQAQLSLERLNCNERLKRQVQQACVLESLSLGVASHLCSGVMQNISVTIRSRLRNLLYYIHENCLVLLDMVCQRWLLENQNHWQESSKTGHCPENLNLDILVRVKRYRRLRRGEHVMALRQHNEMIVNVVRQLCRGAAPKRPPLSSRGGTVPGTSGSAGMRSPGGSRDGRDSTGQGQQPSALGAVNDILTARVPLDRLRASTIRTKMLQYMCFKPLLNVDGADPDCPWPTEDPYQRYGADQFAQDGPIIWFEPLPPMLPDLERNPKLPPATPDAFTLVLDLDETLVHYFELDGMGNYDIRPGMHEFLERMSQLGYEIVIFTAATQDYADWVIDQIDPTRLVHHRLYRQHALPWGPIFVKDLSRLGRELDRTLIIDNVQENFMLQPHNGIFICTWYDDPNDTALRALTPLLDELIATRSRVPEILDKYRDQIPTWAGFDQYSQLGAEYSSDFDLNGEEVEQGMHTQDPPPAMAAPGMYHNGVGNEQPQVEMPARRLQQPFTNHTPQATQDFHPPEREQQPQDDFHGPPPGSASTQPTYASADAVSGYTGPAASPYGNRFPQPQQPSHSSPAQYLNSPAQRTSGTGYPQPGASTHATTQLHTAPQARDAAQAQKPQPSRSPATMQLQGQPGITAAPQAQQQGSPSPQGAPRPQVQTQPAPAFSGIAGPYQAPAPTNAVWGRAGLGPYQAMARRH